MADEVCMFYPTLYMNTYMPRERKKKNEFIMVMYAVNVCLSALLLLLLTLLLLALYDNKITKCRTLKIHKKKIVYLLNSNEWKYSRSAVSHLVCGWLPLNRMINEQLCRAGSSHTYEWILDTWDELRRQNNTIRLIANSECPFSVSTRIWQTCRY